MPWKETRIVDQRIDFIAAVRQDPRGNFTRICERFGISRQTGYAVLKRLAQRGGSGLEDAAPVAKECPHKTSAEMEDRVIAMRKAHPLEGPKKLRDRMRALAPELAVPAASTIGDILQRRGQIRPRRTRVRVPPHPSPLEPCSEPNELWCVDFKGHFALGDGTRCHPLTMTDGATRYLITCEALTAEKEVLARPHFERAFIEFGLPARIRSDNGAPFASRAIGGLSALSVWWIQLGITPERIEPGQPQQNGRHERFHRTLKDHTTKPPANSMAAQQRCFDHFRRDYNEARPHEALAMKPPASIFEPSWRPMREPREPSYGDGFEVRRISENGRIQISGSSIYIGKVLAKQPLGLCQTDEDEWEVHYGPLLVGYALRRGGTCRIEPIA